MKLLKHTPLSIAALAGRTAWQSFHKGGIYENPTDNITKDDFEFLKRLFNKFKHLSVAEHLKYTFEMNEQEYDYISYLEEGYLLKETIRELEENGIKEYFYITIDMRFLLENKDMQEIKKLVDIIPKIHQDIFYDKDFSDENYLENEFKTIELENVELLYHLDNGLADYMDFVSLRIKNISRAMLQELVRHDDFLSPTIKSTRYTLKELKDEDDFSDVIPLEPGILSRKYDFERAKKYVKLTGNDVVDRVIVRQLDSLRVLINSSISNDIVKYALPEAYLTEGVFTLPIRNLKNMIKLRTDKSALWEFQEVAKQLEKVLEFLVEK